MNEKKRCRLKTAPKESRSEVVDRLGLSDSAFIRPIFGRTRFTLGEYFHLSPRNDYDRPVEQPSLHRNIII